MLVKEVLIQDGALDYICYINRQTLIDRKNNSIDTVVFPKVHNTN